MESLQYIIIGLIILLLIFITLFIIQNKKNRKIRQLKYEEIDKNFKERKDNLEEQYSKTEEKLKQEYQKLNKELEEELSNNIEKINFEISKYHEQSESNKEIISKQIKQNLEITKKLEEEKIRTQLNEFKKSEEKKINDELKTAQEWTQKQIEDLQKSKEEYEKETNEAAFEYVDILELLEDFRARREVVNSQILREKALQEETDFYRICLTDNEIEDLQIIKDIEHKFNNKEVLHRAAYDCYIKRPLQEMEKRVLNGKKPSGIYCITYIPTGEIYIGRSTDIGNRWQEHCKSAYGVGTIAHSSLHTKMARDGIWNFTFQVLEEVPKDKLNEREKYWIDVYGAQTLLNQKAGG